MSQENIEVVQEAFGAYFRDDATAMRELAASEIVVTTRPDQPDLRDYHGYDGLIEALSQWVDMWDDYSVEVTRVWDIEDFVFVHVRQRGQGKGSGVPIDDEVLFVFTVRLKRIARLQMFGTEQEALGALGLGESQ